MSNGGLSGNIPSGTTDFIYRDWQVVEERTGSTVNKQYVWGDYVDECIQLRTYVTSGAGSLPAGIYYLLQDLLYRTKALTDTNGDIVEAYDYDPYGNTLIFSAAGAEDNWWADDATQVSYAACEVLYAGYRYDAESRTYQVRNRQYNPALGRWIQRDPIGFEGGDWNLYGYVNERAINNFDPNGLSGDSLYNKTYDWLFNSPRGWVDCFGNCIEANDPLNLLAKGIFTGIGGTIPKSLGKLIGVRTTRFAGASNIMTLPSAVSQRLGMDAGNALRVGGRIVSPYWIAYGNYMATVELRCGYACHICSIAY